MTKKRHLQQQIGRCININSKSAPANDTSVTYTILQLMNEIFIVKMEETEKSNEVDPSLSSYVYESYISHMKLLQSVKFNNVSAFLEESPAGTVCDDYIKQEKMMGIIGEQFISDKCLFHHELPTSLSYGSCNTRLLFPEIWNQISTSIDEDNCHDSKPSKEMDGSFMFAPVPLDKVRMIVSGNELTVKVDTSFAEKKRKFEKGDDAKLVATVQYNLDEVSL